MKRVSRWIKIDYIPITKRHRLWDYAKDNDGILCCFRHKGKTYALSEFIRRDSIYGDLSTEYPSYIHGCCANSYYNPLFIEIESGGEAVRLYKDVTKEAKINV
jgi:hypothetical protein